MGVNVTARASGKAFLARMRGHALGDFRVYNNSDYGAYASAKCARCGAKAIVFADPRKAGKETEGGAFTSPCPNRQGRETK